MKSSLPIVLLLLLLTLSAKGQTVDADPASNPDNFYVNQPLGDMHPQPLPFLRDVDIVWSTTLWKTIHVQELFNQFFYFPDDEYITFGKKSLAYILWDAVVANEIPIYDDDRVLIPLDNDEFVRRFTRADTLQLEIGYDEDENEIYETVIRPRHFDGSEILAYSLREVWFVGRQDTRQDSRRIALAPIKETYRELPNGEDIYLGNLPIFWIPLQHPAVRNLLVRYTAYVDPENIARQPSWDWVFLAQYYNALTTRESNLYDRSVSNYLTGEDAVLEAALIEDKVMQVENDMWEY
ncbi:MAG: gliding motility protein GldN [Bacteroidales bacterium]|nr:gliding motility protein GldN [Bacteroidales bacterium]